MFFEYRCQGGTANVFGNPLIVSGKYGSAVNFDGIDDYIRWSQSIPVNNLTVEFWFKSGDTSGTILMLEYAFNTGITVGGNTVTTIPTWSTGQTGNSITVNPNNMPYVWVSNGSCNDTIFFNSQAATIYDTTNVTVYDTMTVTIYDTITTFISVTDTLIINAVISSVNPPNNVNTLLIYPNPANTHITIDNGNFASMAGYSVRINNALGQLVFNQNITQQQFFIDLSTWTGPGMYYVNILDPNGNPIEVKKIVIQ